MPPNWPEKFLAVYRVEGAMYWAARKVGVSIDAVRAREDENPQFREAVLVARQEAADEHVRNLNRMAKRGNVVASIVRLKAVRPAEYIERHAVLNVSLAGTLSADDGLTVLHAMLQHATDTTRRAIEAAPLQVEAATLEDTPFGESQPPPPGQGRGEQ